MPDALIEKALTDNFDLRGAWNRLAQARAIAPKTDAVATRHGLADQPRLETDTLEPRLFLRIYFTFDEHYYIK